jgi:protein-tyrosine phosphatase
MKNLISPSARKLERFIAKEGLVGKTILHHTGSMFGIGCLASDHETIQRICKLKQREDSKGFIVLVPDAKWFEDMGIQVPERIVPLANQYWPGNLTLVFECDHPDFAHLAVDGKVAFRVPNDSLLRLLIDLAHEPIVSTSINLSLLPAEEDYRKIVRQYRSWFDVAIHPAVRSLPIDAQPSTIVEYVEGENQGPPELKCLREGSIPFYEIKNSFVTPQVTFVCTANICRSPMAEKLFSYVAEKRNLNVRADSCGLIEGGHMISTGSLQLLLNQGILEAQSHVSKQITPQIVSESWLMLTMEERQRDFIRSNEPHLKHKIFTLNEIVGEPGDIEDPYGSEFATYQKTFEIIEDRITRLIDLIDNRKLSLSNGDIK